MKRNRDDWAEETPGEDRDQKLRNLRHGKGTEKRETPKGSPSKARRKAFRQNENEADPREECLAVIEQNLRQSVKDEISTHRVIRTDCCQWLELFWIKAVRNWCCECCRSESALAQLYEEGQGRLKREMDIVDIIKKLRYLKVLANSSHLRPDHRKFSI